jgi:outer membrane lipoprotein SlyB
MKILPLLLIPALLAGCVKNPSQNTYNYNEVGQSVIVEFAQVVQVKEVDIQGRNTGTGAALGAAAGGTAGYQVGNGNGQLGGAIAGVLVGAVAGAAIEQAAANQKGYEYIVVTEHKETKTIVQYQDPKDVVFKKGDRVMVQTKGTYQRVMSTEDLPSEVKRPKGIKIVD